MTAYYPNKAATHSPIRCAEVAETTSVEASTVEHLHVVIDQIVVQGNLKS